MHDSYELMRYDKKTGKTKLVKEVNLKKLDKLKKIKHKKVSKDRKKGHSVKNEHKIM